MQGHTQENWHDGTEVFFILNTQQIVPVQNKQTPQSFYVKGIIEEGQFNPKSGVLGIGELAGQDAGRYGWLELLSREFYPMESDRKAMTPFVKGYMIPNKGFVPSHRDVFNEP